MTPDRCSAVLAPGRLCGWPVEEPRTDEDLVPPAEPAPGLCTWHGALARLAARGVEIRPGEPGGPSRSL